MNQQYSRKERAHIEKIKTMPCIVCGADSPTEAHHIKQALPYSVVPLCHDCHRGARNGWHGERAMWKIMKLDELGALALTIERLMGK